MGWPVGGTPARMWDTHTRVRPPGAASGCGLRVVVDHRSCPLSAGALACYLRHTHPRPLCAPSQNPPDWQEILTYFRGSELQVRDWFFGGGGFSSLWTTERCRNRTMNGTERAGGGRGWASGGRGWDWARPGARVYVHG